MCSFPSLLLLLSYVQKPYGITHAMVDLSNLAYDCQLWQ